VEKTYFYVIIIIEVIKDYNACGFKRRIGKYV